MKITLKNIVPNPSFEQDSSWIGILYDTSEKLIGSRSSRLEGTTVTRASVISPIVGHKYYGRSYIKSSGTIGAADDRFEWFAGDGYGLNFVFAHNNGNYPNWTMRSSIISVDAVNGQNYSVRNFVVAAKNTCWTDGLMIVDLTEAFGAGKEPDQQWCDANIPFFDGEMSLEVYETSDIVISDAYFSPNPVSMNTKTIISVLVSESSRIFVPYKLYSGDLYAGEV